MPPSAKTVSTLLGLLYEASASPEHWSVFLAALVESSHAETAAFVLVDTEDRGVFFADPGFDPKWERAYTDHYRRYDELFERFVAASRVHGGWVGTNESLFANADLHRTLIFNEFVRPMGMTHQFGATMVGLDGGMEGGVTLLRPAAPGAFGREAVSLLTLLAPHLKRALNTHRALSQARCQNAELRHSVEALDLAVISLDGCGRVVRMSAAAETILDLRRGIVVDGGFLRASVATEQARLAELIGGAVATGKGQGEGVAVRQSTESAPEAGSGPLWTPAHGGAMVISRWPPSRPLKVVVTPFHSSEVLLGDQPAALVFFSDPDARPASRASILRALYGLTPTECRLAGLLVEGFDLATAAEQLKMAADTARFHLKTIFRKTGARRQSDLMRLVLGLPGGFAA